MFKSRINISFITNPFFVYPAVFIVAIITYLFGWSDLYPRLSLNLIMFLVASFIPFIVLGFYFEKIKYSVPVFPVNSFYFRDKIFFLTIFMGLADIILMGYIPFFDRSHNYKNFGAPVVDVLFNTLSIFSSVFFLETFLTSRKKRFLFYILFFLAIQLLLFRRSTIIWIITSSTFLLIIHLRTIDIRMLVSVIVLVPIFSFLFGVYGNIRSDMTHEIALNDMGASKSFKNTGLSHNHYMTYLYLSSPLANLQKNINPGDKFLKEKEIKNFFFYCLIPPSLTMRLEKVMNLAKPEYKLVVPYLIVGSCYMLSYTTMGWFGMIIMMVFLILYAGVCLLIVHKWNSCYYGIVSLLSTAMSFQIFDNMFIRLDVILILFFYPLIFHFLEYNFHRKTISN